jgi:hypothetical protein
MYIKIIAVTCSFIVWMLCFVDSSQSEPEGLDIVKQRSQSKALQAVGFPFTDYEMLLRSKELNDIAKQIQLWKKEKLDTPENLVAVLSSCKQRNEENVLATKNLGVLDEQGIDTQSLFSALYLLAASGKIPDIEVLLEYASVYVGPHSDANEFPMFGMGMAMPMQPKQLTTKQRLCLWPAANTLLSHPEPSMPLLEAAVRNARLSEPLRLRAAAFIHEMEPERLTGEWFDSLDDRELARKMQCIQQGGMNWKTLTGSPCKHAEYQEVNDANWRRIRSQQRDGLRQQEKKVGTEE